MMDMLMSRLHGIHIAEVKPDTLFFSEIEGKSRLCLCVLLPDYPDQNVALILSPNDLATNIVAVSETNVMALEGEWFAGCNASPEDFFFPTDTDGDRSGSILFGKSGPLAIVAHTMINDVRYYDMKTRKIVKQRPEATCALGRWSVLLEVEDRNHLIADVETVETLRVTWKK